MNAGVRRTGDLKNRGDGSSRPGTRSRFDGVGLAADSGYNRGLFSASENEPETPMRYRTTPAALLCLAGQSGADSSSPLLQDPHTSEAGFFDIHVCNWPDRERLCSRFWL